MPFLCIGLRCFAFKVSPTVENDRGTVNMASAIALAYVQQTQVFARFSLRSLMQWIQTRERSI
jgi:hypothetical protein